MLKRRVISCCSLHISRDADIAHRIHERHAESEATRQWPVHGDLRGHDDLHAEGSNEVLMELVYHTDPVKKKLEQQIRPMLL